MKTSFLLKTDDDIKKKATAIYNNLGMNLTTALNIFLHQTVIQGRFPCTIDSSELTDNKNTYPDGFFALFGSGNDLGLDEEPAELPIDRKDIEL